MQIRRLDIRLDTGWGSGNGLKIMQYNTSRTNSEYFAEGLLIQQSNGQHVLIWPLWSQAGAANWVLRWQTGHRPISSISLLPKIVSRTIRDILSIVFIHRLSQVTLFACIDRRPFIR